MEDALCRLVINIVFGYAKLMVLQQIVNVIRCAAYCGASAPVFTLHSGQFVTLAVQVHDNLPHELIRVQELISWHGIRPDSVHMMPLPINHHACIHLSNEVFCPPFHYSLPMMFSKTTS